MSPKKKLTKIERTAYHEAGHAVVAYFLRYAHKVRKVTIVPDKKENTLGHVRSWARPSVDYNDADSKTYMTVQSEIMGLLAGGIAEKLASGRRNPKGSSFDMHGAVDLAVSLHGSGELGSAYVAWLARLVEAMLRSQWKYVQHVAQSLLTHKTLTRKGIEDAFRCADLAQANAAPPPRLPPALRDKAVGYCVEAFKMMEDMTPEQSAEFHLAVREAISAAIGKMSMEPKALDHMFTRLPRLARKVSVLELICWSRVIDGYDPRAIVDVGRESTMAAERYKKNKKTKL